MPKRIPPTYTHQDALRTHRQYRYHRQHHRIESVLLALAMTLATIIAYLIVPADGILITAVLAMVSAPIYNEELETSLGVVLALKMVSLYLA